MGVFLKHKHVQEEINYVCVAGYKVMYTKCVHSFLCYSCYLLLVECIKVDTSGLRTGSSVLTGEEKSEQPRPSELIGTEPLLTECSLKTHTNHRNGSNLMKSQDGIYSHNAITNHAKENSSTPRNFY